MIAYAIVCANHGDDTVKGDKAVKRQVLFPCIIVLGMLTAAAMLGLAQALYPYEASSNAPTTATEYVPPTSTPTPVATPVPDNAVFYLEDRLTGVAISKCLVHLVRKGQEPRGMNSQTTDDDILSDRRGRISWMLPEGYYALNLDCTGLGSNAASAPYVFRIDHVGELRMENGRGDWCQDNQPIVLAISRPTNDLMGGRNQSSVEICRDQTIPDPYISPTPGVQ